MSKLKIGSTIQTADGEPIEILDTLGEGGQGIVYKVNFRGKPHALKWYAKGVGGDAEKFYRNLQNNIAKGAPVSTFLWPLAATALVNMNGTDCFGYVMEIRPTEYKDFSRFLLNHVQFASLKAMVNAALQIVTSFKLLHNRGFSYQDLNDGNFFINPDTGDVLICDNDNVVADGFNLGIQGKPRYMAPEVVTLEKKPDTFSDRFSLSVVLFLLFFKDHPLAGERDNNKIDPAKNEMQLYCENPVFVFDPKDASNRPKPEIHKNVLRFWELFPSGIRMAFIRAFSKDLMKSDGAPNRENRPIEKEWLKELFALRNQIIACPACGEETFFESDDNEHICINCGKAYAVPPRLKVGKFIKPLQPGEKLYRYEVENVDMTVDLVNEAWGEVIQNKKNPSIWGFRNLSPKTWHKKTPAGKDELVEPNGVIPVARGIKIDFVTDKTVGEIE